MVDIVTSTEIARPLETVADYAADPDHAPEWYVNIQSVVWKSPRPLRQGSKVAFVARFMGRTLAYTYEVTEFLPHQKLVMQTAEGPFPMQTTYTWEVVAPSVTRMTLRNAGMPSGFSRFLAPLMATMMRSANRKDLKKLKKILES